jgi:predicted nuclease with TOPRIM domain
MQFSSPNDIIFFVEKTLWLVGEMYTRTCRRKQLKVTLKLKRDSEKKLTELLAKKEKLYAEKKELNREVLEVQRLLEKISETVALLERKKEARRLATIIRKNLLKARKL